MMIIECREDMCVKLSQSKIYKKKGNLCNPKDQEKLSLLFMTQRAMGVSLKVIYLIVAEYYSK